jgi:hypothetical protein
MMRMTAKTMLLGAVALLSACSNSPVNQSDASTDAASDGAQEAAVTCTTPGAACPGGGSCFFLVGDCTATTGICADDTGCSTASTETVCHCDGTQAPVPQCGPGGYALAKAVNYGPCTGDAGGSDAGGSDAGADAGGSDASTD